MRLFSFRKLIWQIDIPVSFAESEDSLHLDLGSGINPRNPFRAKRVVASDISEVRYEPSAKRLFGTDYRSITFDLTMSFPIESSSVTSFSAYDVIEHLPRWERLNNKIRFPFVHFMQEVYRCLKPGGYFLAVTPYFPNKSSFIDPTHVNHLSKETVNYFCDSELIQRLTSSYGFTGRFECVYCATLRGPGPFLEANQLMESIRKDGSLIIYSLKYFKRFVRLICSPKGSHLLWVLRKPE